MTLDEFEKGKFEYKKIYQFEFESGLFRLLTPTYYRRPYFEFYGIAQSNSFHDWPRRSHNDLPVTTPDMRTVVEVIEVPLTDLPMYVSWHCTKVYELLMEEGVFP
jgi:hypothetical protein